ncbi:MAG TPA: hypothetical protein VE056_08280, partial [Pyrinomonadaceae bacterium]|nr:hypothetical protein [Pyrinomonadaceae bacterium]
IAWSSRSSCRACSNATGALTLPEPLYPLYYLFRPLRLLKKYSSAGWEEAAEVKVGLRAAADG